MTDEEMKRAMLVAARTYTGTSLVAGATRFLSSIYSPHAFVGDGAQCNRCGKDKTHHD